MRSSSTDAPGRGAPVGRGTWVRLAVLVLLVALLALGPVPGSTRALLTDTTQVTTVVSTLPDFPPPTAG